VSQKREFPIAAACHRGDVEEVTRFPDSHI
jgi:hypothetical protein